MRADLGRSEMRVRDKPKRKRNDAARWRSASLSRSAVAALATLIAFNTPSSSSLAEEVALELGPDSLVYVEAGPTSSLFRFPPGARLILQVGDAQAAAVPVGVASSGVQLGTATAPARSAEWELVAPASGEFRANAEGVVVLTLFGLVRATDPVHGTSSQYSVLLTTSQPPEPIPGAGSLSGSLDLASGAVDLVAAGTMTREQAGTAGFFHARLSGQLSHVPNAVRDLE